MPQNVLVSVLGEGKYLTALVRAILEKNIIPTRFLFLSAKNEASLQAAEGYDVTVCEDELSAVLKSEIVLVTASRREMPSSRRSRAARRKGLSYPCATATRSIWHTSASASLPRPS